ncbi:MAG: ATP-binding protein [Nocardioidaceae bacterium]
MSHVSLAVGADPAHVRVVRLVAGAVARRAGVDEESVDEVKLAVGEACALAVSAMQAHDLTGHSDRLSIEIEDGSGVEVVVRAPVDLEQHAQDVDAGELFPDGLAVIRGLLDDVSISSDSSGSLVRMSWAAGVAHPTV